MAQKSILITGCSSGIGYCAAHELKKDGWRVFAACRKQADCDRLIAEGLESPLLDYEDEKTIETAVDEVLKATGGTLDAIFNNGAYGIPALVEDLPTDALRAIFEANFFGWHALARRVMPVMRQQGHGRIVQCSSILGFITLPFRGAYNATKFAVEGLSDTMRIELDDTNIHIVLIEPGPVTSKIRQNSIPHFERWIDWESSALRDKYENGLRKRLYGESTPDPFELPPEAVVDRLRHALNSPRPRPRYYVTKPTYIMGFLKRILSTRALDKVLVKIS